MPEFRDASPCKARWYASRSHVSSMWCASVVSPRFGSIRASSASFSYRVEMTSRPDVLAICPSRSPMPGPPLPVGRFPRLQYDRRTTTPRRPSHHLASLPSVGGITRCLVHFPEPGRCPEPRLFRLQRPRRSLLVETVRFPRFLGGPPPACPTLRLRRTPCIRPLRCSGYCLPYSKGRRLRAYSPSRLNHAAYRLPVYASQPGSLPHHATLGSGWWSWPGPPRRSGAGPPGGRLGVRTGAAARYGRAPFLAVWIAERVQGP